MSELNNGSSAPSKRRRKQRVRRLGGPVLVAAAAGLVSSQTVGADAWVLNAQGSTHCVVNVDAVPASMTCRSYNPKGVAIESDTFTVWWLDGCEPRLIEGDLYRHAASVVFSAGCALPSERDMVASVPGMPTQGDSVAIALSDAYGFVNVSVEKPTRMWIWGQL